MFCESPKYPLYALPSQLNPVRFQIDRALSCCGSAYFSLKSSQHSRYLFHGLTRSNAAYEWFEVRALLFQDVCCPVTSLRERQNLVSNKQNLKSNCFQSFFFQLLQFFRKKVIHWIDILQAYSYVKDYFCSKSLEKVHVEVLNRKKNNSKPKETPSAFKVCKRCVTTHPKQADFGLHVRKCQKH